LPMEVKQILEKIRQPKKEGKEYFFALQIGTDFVKSAIWTVTEGQVKVLAIGKTQEWRNQEELLGVVDETLSSATEQFLPEAGATEPNKVIFGLPPDWVEGERIVADKIKLLKTLSEKLELNPVGFVVTVEALIHHLKKIEGVPPTAILFGVGVERSRITLVNLGKIVGTEIVKKSENLGADLIEGLSRFKAEAQFPARILLYQLGKVPDEAINKEEGALEEARQELVKYPWHEGRLKFFHLPKVEILSDDFDIKAVGLAGGYEVAKAEGVTVLEPAEEKEREEPKGLEEKEEETFGFIKGKDVAQEIPPEAPEAEEEERKIAEETVEEEAPIPLAKPSVEPSRFSFLIAKLSQFKFPKFNLAGLKAVVSGFNFEGRTPLIIGLVGAFLLIIIGGLFALYWYLPQAEVVLTMSPQRLEKEFTLKLDPNLETANKEELALPAEEVTATFEGEKTKETTGTKPVGDPAKGEVTIYNQTSSKKTFSAGTEIIGPDDLTFSLDEDVTVASESAGPDYTKIPGKASVKVTALEIGSEGNLAAGTEFKISNYASSDFIAKNENALSDGTSREVQVVSEDDQDKLLAELEGELKNKAVGELSTKVPGGKRLLEESLSTKVVEKSFNKKAGEETNEVKLSLKLEATALSYSEEEAQALIEEKIKDSVPSDFEYKREESEVSFTLDEVNKDGSALFTAKLKADLLPKMDLEEVKKNLAGKYPEIGKTYLDNLSNVEGVTIKISPPFPGRLATFPRRASRIEIELRIE